MGGRYLEDFAVGQTFGSGRLRVEAAAIKSFAAEFDPQSFHLDEGAARDSFFGSLAASGWHTAALTMRLLVEGDLRPAGGIIGTSLQLSWTKPVRPGDRLSARCTVAAARPSKSRPELGIVDFAFEALNQKGEVVMTEKLIALVKRRPEAEGAP